MVIVVSPILNSRMPYPSISPVISFLRVSTPLLISINDDISLTGDYNNINNVNNSQENENNIINTKY